MIDTCTCIPHEAGRQGGFAETSIGTLGEKTLTSSGSSFVSYSLAQPFLNPRRLKPSCKMSFFLPQVFRGFPVTDFHPLRTAAQQRLFQSMLSHWYDSLNSGDEGPGDVFITACPLWRMLSSHFQLSLVADLARWCLCEGEPVPKSLSLFHKAALWALHFNFAGALECEIDTDTPFGPPDPSPSVDRRLGGPASSWEASVTWNKAEILRESAALVAAQGGDTAALGLDVLPHAAERGDGAASGAGMGRRRLSFLSAMRRALPAPRDAPPPAVPSHYNRLRRLLLEAWQAWGGAGGLSPLRLPAEVFAEPGGGALRRLAITADGMGSDEMRALLPLVVVRAVVGLGDSDEGLLLGRLKVEDAQRMRALLGLAERANTDYEAAWRADKARTARDVAVVSLLSRTGSLWGSDVDPETEWEGDRAREPEDSELHPCDAHSRAAEYRESTRAFATLHADGEAEPHASDCRDGVADLLGGHPNGGPTQMDRAAFASGALGEPLAWGCTQRISERREARMVGEFHAAMEALHGGGAGAAALEAAYDSPRLRLAAIRAISHPAAPVWLDLTPPFEERRALQQRRAEELLSCDLCSAVCDAGALHLCSGCRVARYCGRACQKRAWPTHKPVCLAIRSAPVKASS